MERCRVLYPGLEIAGFRDGYFGPEDHPNIVEHIKASDHMLFVGMAARGEDIEANEHLDVRYRPELARLDALKDLTRGMVEDVVVVLD